MDSSGSSKMDPRYTVVTTFPIFILVTWHWGSHKIAQGHDFGRSFQVTWTVAVAGQWTLDQRKYAAYMQFSSRLWVEVESALNLTIRVNDEIILSKLGIGDLFYLFVKTSTYSVFHLTPIFFSSHFLSRDILITKTLPFWKIFIS